MVYVKSYFMVYVKSRPTICTSCSLGICFVKKQLDIIAEFHVPTVHSVHVLGQTLTQAVEHVFYKLC